MNSKENFWHEMKEFNRKELKPTRKDELVERAFRRFWRTVEVAKCNKYIKHLEKVCLKL